MQPHDGSLAAPEFEELAHAISHDLRSPLRGIANLSQWLAKDQADRLDADGREQLALLGERVDWLERRIAALVEYARAGTGEAPRPVQASEIVNEIWGQLQPRADLVLALESPLPSVSADPERLRRLLFVLIENAVGHAGAEAHEVRVTGREDGAWVEIAVVDDGVGIEIRNHERVFVLFQSLAGPSGGRVGAGLAIAKRIAMSLGGDLTLRAGPGPGAQFRLRLPRPQPPGAPEASTAA